MWYDTSTYGFFLLIIENMYKETYLSMLVLAWEQCM